MHKTRTDEQRAITCLLVDKMIPLLPSALLSLYVREMMMMKLQEIIFLQK